MQLSPSSKCQTLYTENCFLTVLGPNACLYERKRQTALQPVFRISTDLPRHSAISTLKAKG